MKELQVLDYCVVGEWVYYVTLGDAEGFHCMLLDGTEDRFICDFSKLKATINGSTSITSEVKDNHILYKVEQLREYDTDGKLEQAHPIDYYLLDLASDTLEWSGK